MEKNDSLYVIPEYVAKYCTNRYVEYVDYLTEKQYSALYQMSEKNPDIKLKTLESEKDSQYIRCLVNRRVLPLTVMKNPLLLRAAELENKTRLHSISLQEARIILTEEYPHTNCSDIYPYSVFLLIRKNKGCYILDSYEAYKMSRERKKERGLCTV